MWCSRMWDNNDDNDDNSSNSNSINNNTYTHSYSNSNSNSRISRWLIMIVSIRCYTHSLISHMCKKYYCQTPYPPARERLPPHAPATSRRREFRDVVFEDVAFEIHWRLTLKH